MHSVRVLLVASLLVAARFVYERPLPLRRWPLPQTLAPREAVGSKFWAEEQLTYAERLPLSPLDIVDLELLNGVSDTLAGQILGIVPDRRSCEEVLDELPRIGSKKAAFLCQHLDPSR